MSVSNVSSSFTLPIPSLTTTKSVDSSSLTTSVADTTTSSAVDATIPTKWGFKVDANGFFGTDFNAAAGIPADVKINQKQMDMVEQYTSVVGSSDDPVTALGKVWSFFSKVAGGSLSSTGTMSINQVNNMPYGFQSDGSLLDNPVSVQKTMDEMDKMISTKNNVQAMSNNTLDTGLQGLFGGLTAWDPDGDQVKELYQSAIGTQYDPNEQKGQLGVGELFGSFCALNLQDSKEHVQMIQSYYSVLKSGQDFQSYLTNQFGPDYMKQLADHINTMPDGKVIPNMIDDLFKTLDEAMKTNYSEYLKSQNGISDSIPQNTNTVTALNSSSSTYQSIGNNKLPSAGSLINIGI